MRWEPPSWLEPHTLVRKLSSRARASARARSSPPPNPHYNQPSGHWPCVKSCLVEGSDNCRGRTGKRERERQFDFASSFYMLLWSRHLVAIRSTIWKARVVIFILQRNISIGFITFVDYIYIYIYIYRCVCVCVSKDVHRCVLIARIIHIIFHEQAVCKRNTKMKKRLLAGCRQYNHVAISFPEKARERSQLSKEQRQKEPTKGLSMIVIRHLTGPPLNMPTIWGRQTFIICLNSIIKINSNKKTNRLRVALNFGKSGEGKPRQ